MKTIHAPLADAEVRPKLIGVFPKPSSPSG